MCTSSACICGWSRRCWYACQCCCGRSRCAPAKRSTQQRSATRMPEQRDIVVVGAGPSGSIVSALLQRRGWDVLVLEAQQFPRFSIGESLLAHCLDFVAEAGMIDAVEAAGFQYKNGAAFV